MKHWLIKQVWKVASDKTLVCTIRVLSTSLQLMKHVLENLHWWLHLHYQMGTNQNPISNKSCGPFSENNSSRKLPTYSRSLRLRVALTQLVEETWWEINKLIGKAKTARLNYALNPFHKAKTMPDIQLDAMSTEGSFAHSLIKALLLDHFLEGLATGKVKGKPKIWISFPNPLFSSFFIWFPSIDPSTNPWCKHNLKLLIRKAMRM